MDSGGPPFWQQTWLYTHIIAFLAGWAVAAWVYVG